MTGASLEDRRVRFALAAVLMLAAALRVFGLDRDFYSLQEATYHDESIVPSVADVLTSPGALYQAHMPAWRLSLWPLQWIAASPGFLRLWSALWGVIGVGLMFLAARPMVGRGAALGAALLLAVSPLHVFYSRELGPYTMGLAVSLLSLRMLYGYAWEWRAWRGRLVASSVVAVYVHFSYVSWVAGVFGAMALLAWRDRARRREVLHRLWRALWPTALLLLPALGLFLVAAKWDASVGDLWHEVRAYVQRPSLAWAFTEDLLLANRHLAGIPWTGGAGVAISAAALAGVAALAAIRHEARPILVLLAVLAGAHLLAHFAFSYLFPTLRAGFPFAVYMIRHYLPLAPMVELLIVLGAAGAAASLRRVTGRAGVGAAAAAVVLLASVSGRAALLVPILSEPQRPDTRAVADLLRAQLEDGDAVLALPAFYHQLMLDIALSESDPPRSSRFLTEPWMTRARDDGRRVTVAVGLLRPGEEPLEAATGVFLRDVWVVHYRETTLGTPDPFRQEAARSELARLRDALPLRGSWRFHDVDLYRFGARPPPTVEGREVHLALGRGAAPFVRGFRERPLQPGVRLGVKSALPGEVKVRLAASSGPDAVASASVALEVTAEHWGCVLTVETPGGQARRFPLETGATTIRLDVPTVADGAGRALHLVLRLRMQDGLTLPPEADPEITLTEVRATLLPPLTAPGARRPPADRGEIRREHHP